MGQTAPDHFHDIRRTGDVDPEIFPVEFMHDSFQFRDWLLSVITVLEQDNEVCALAILRNEQPSPERARHRVSETLWTFGYAFHRADTIDRLYTMSESLHPA